MRQQAEEEAHSVAELARIASIEAEQINVEDEKRVTAEVGHLQAEAEVDRIEAEEEKAIATTA